MGFKGKSPKKVQTTGTLPLKGMARSFSKRTKEPVAQSRSKTKNTPVVTNTVKKSKTNAPFKKQNPPPLWKHQKQTLALARKNLLVFDASDPGTGKTRAHLEAFAERRRKRSKAALVLAPKSLLESAWGADIKKYVRDMGYSCAYAANREKAFEEGDDIYITNLDAVKWLVTQPKKFFNRFDTLIIDESTAFKHRNSQRSKAVKKIAKHFKYKTLMTGTPTSGNIQDIWHQIFLLDEGKRLGKVFYQFRDAVCFFEQTGRERNHGKWHDKAGAEEAVAGLLMDISIRHVFDECMDIPPNFTYTVKYEPSTKLLKAYKEIEDHCILRLKDKNIDAVNAAVLRNKLLQICSGAVYDSDSEYHLIDTGRYELIIDLALQAEHSLVFFNWSHQKTELIKEAEKRKITYAVIDGTTTQRKGAVDDIVNQYQAGLLRTLFLHPQTGAHGLTLTRGIRTILSSPIYQPDLLKQMKHRTWRGTQDKKTETILIQANKTIEGHVYKMLQDKNRRMINLLDIMTSTDEEENNV